MTSPSKAAFPLLLAIAGLASTPAAHANVITAPALSASAPEPSPLAVPPALLPGNAAVATVLPPGSVVAYEQPDPRLAQNAILPEPATIAVLGIGLLGLGFLRRTRTR